MKASIIIPTKNAGPGFEAVLDSLRSQETPWPFDVLVVDSGSRDGTLDLARRRGVPLHEIPPQSFGHGRTRNLGASLTQGEWIVFLTQDAVPGNRRWLRRLIEGGERAADVAGVFGRHLPRPSASPLLADELNRFFDGFREASPVVRLDDPQRWVRDSGYRRWLHFFSNNNAAIRRRVWRGHPLPEVDFAEDQLWAKEVLEAGYAKAYADDARVFHSHDFAFLEGLRRSFDEAFHWRLAGYESCPSLRHLLKEAWWGTWGDWRHARRSRLPLRCYGEAPVRQLSRWLGAYLGQRGERLPPALVARLSRDRALWRQT